MDTAPPGAKSSRQGGTTRLTPADACPSAFNYEEYARQSPDALALVFRDRRVTYAELDAQVNQLAHHLQHAGVGPEVLVGICLDRGIEAIVAMLGVLKAGGAFVPLDPEYPQQRLEFVLNDTASAVVLTQRHLLARLSGFAAGKSTSKIVCLDDQSSVISGEPIDAPDDTATDANLAYVIYTSGSTGDPKGVVIERRGLRNMAETAVRTFALKPGDRVLQFSALSFDASIFEIAMGLRAGATLVIAPPECRVPGPALSALLRDHEITIVTFPPSVLAALPSEDLPSLKVVTVAGEACAAELVERWAPHRRFFNLYGPTEATVWATMAECFAGPEKPSIGQAIPNARVYLLDSQLRETAPGEPGELHIGGIGLARGYLNRPELTVEKFIPDPFDTERKARLYKTGDIGRLLPDGSIDFIGRQDHQVKLRGFRIELGEIEAAVRSYAGVLDAVVALKQGAAGEQQLVAYVVPDADSTAWQDDSVDSRTEHGGRDAADTDGAPPPSRQIPALRRYLEQKLPQHMLPGAFVLMKALPLTIQGKVDRRALPEPRIERSQMSSDYEAPRTPFEAELATVWEQVLKVERVGVHDDFFELGGSSLVGAVLINALQKKLGVQLYIVAVFDAPTVAKQAVYLQEHFPKAVHASFHAERKDAAGERVAEHARGSLAAAVTHRDIEEFRGLAAGWRNSETVAASPNLARNRRMAFILSPPRSGSSLFRIMLAGHPRLFAPPELELLSFDTLQHRRQQLSGRLGFMREGLVRALMEIRQCDVHQAEQMVAEHEMRGCPVQTFYGLLQSWIGDRVLVDKSTTYSLSPETLERAESGFEDNVYIHLVRHPCGTIRSFEEARLDRVLTFHGDQEYSVARFAELTWTVSHQNILSFLARIPERRQIRVHFEDLVRDPRPVIEAVCRRLDVEFDPAMLEPYRDQERKMTDGVSRLSVGMTDPKFHSHRNIDPEVAENWQAFFTEDFLSAAAWQLARDLGYEQRAARGAPSGSIAPIEPALRDPANPPLQSYGQQRLWFIDRLAPGNPGYNTSRIIQMDGRLEITALERSLNEIVRRHEVCRTNYDVRHGQPVQIIHEARPSMLRNMDVSSLEPAAQQVELERLAAGEVMYGFDLARDHLCRALLVRAGDERHILILTLHHILSDAWSRGVLHRELSILYDAFVKGEPSPLPDLPIQYADFAVWQRRTIEQQEGRRLRAYWMEQLRDAPPKLELPTDRPRPPVQTYKGANKTFRLQNDLVQKLKVLGYQEGATLFMTLMCAFNVLLGRYCGQPDIVVGIAMSGRNRAELESLIGFFLNTLPIRTQAVPDSSFRRLLVQTRDTCLEAFAHQDYPFDLIVSELKLCRALDHHPVFQVMFAQHQPMLENLDMPGLRSAALSMGPRPMPYDMTVVVVDEPGGLDVVIDYNVDLFDAVTIERLAGHYVNLLEGMVAAPDERISELPLLSEGERDQLLAGWNRTERAYPRDTCVHELFEERARQSPEAIAIECEDDTLSYAELNSRANRLADYLRSMGVGPDVLVGMCMERSANALVAMLGILKAGGAYVPLDPDYPAERLAFMLKDTEAPVVITQGNLQSRLPDSGPRIVCLDRDWPAMEGCSAQDVASAVTAGNLAYVIYTSGSTGTPKGVQVTHRAVNRLVCNTDYVETGSEDRFAQVSVMSFDAATFEIWGALLNGARVVAVPREVSLSPRHFAEFLRRRGITVLFLTTALFNMMAREAPGAFRSLRYVLFGGEAVDPRAVRAVLRDGAPQKLLHVYGPTEVTTFSTWYEVTEVDAAATTVPIGRPIANTTAYVLDEERRPVPVGVLGELYLGGDGLAAGYLKNPELSAAHFVDHPFRVQPGARLYRTGDWVRFREGGVIEFVGRRDDQVKVRGFRIELGEIEATLRELPQVREAVAVIREDEPGDRRVVAYVVAADGQADALGELREVLKQQLPDYMVPSAFVTMDQLPLTSNGKVDRAALPQPRVIPRIGRNVVGPRNTLEQRIAKVWREMLRLETVGVRDNFFDLGGHSLLLVKTLARLCVELDCELEVVDLFTYPTIEALAKHLRERAGAGGLAGKTVDPAKGERRLAAALPDDGESARNKRDLLRQLLTQELDDPSRLPITPRKEGLAALPLSFAQEELWLVDQMDPGNIAFNIAGQPLRLEGRLDTVALHSALNEVVRRHEVLRTTFPNRIGQPVQEIADDYDLPLPITVIEQAGAVGEEVEVWQWFIRELETPFDLGRGPLVRARLLRLNASAHVLLLVMHHIIIDGVSIGLMSREIGKLYKAYTSGQPSPLPPLAVQYADFAIWQRRWLGSQGLGDQLAYWKRQLQGLSELRVPADRPRPVAASYRALRKSILLPRALGDALKDLSRREGVTLFVVLLAAFKVLLHRYTNQNDIVLGSPVTTRRRKELEGLLGFFVNMVVMRSDVGGDPGFREVLSRVRATALGALENSDVPFDLLLQAFRARHGTAHGSLFQVVFIFEGTAPQALESPDLTAKVLYPPSCLTRFDIEAYVRDEAGGLRVVLLGATDLFEGSTLGRMLEHYRMLLEGIVADPDRRISALDMLAPAERAALLTDWNRTVTDYPRDRSIKDLFEAQAARTPDAVAVEYEGHRLTYRELNTRANQVAHHLARHGVRPETLVCICVERSLEMIVGILGILKAGGAYVPLDPDYPGARLMFMLEDTAAPVLLTLARLRDRLPAYGGRVVSLDADWSQISSERQDNPDTGVGAGNLAYVMYTSGSTGRPKGTCIEHRSVVRLVKATNYIELGPDQVFLQYSPISFDASTLEIWGSLLNGGRLVVCPAGILSLAELGSVIRERRVSTLWLTAALFNQMVDEQIDSLRGVRQLLAGGEALSVSHVRRMLDVIGTGRLINGYGPTENTTFTCCYVMTADTRIEHTVPIGRPISNTRVYVLDGKMQPVPVGVYGELYIAGDGLAREYLHRPDLTAERFVPDPFDGDSGARLYRTGDLVRYREDGCIEFLGRADHQVKIRGFRIELGEIETALGQHPQVRDAVALVREDDPGDKRLVAYVVADPHAPPAPDELRRHLRASLPEYMVPGAIVVLETFPLTPNGKVDRAALPKPQDLREAAHVSVAPRSDLEQKIAEVWREMLHLETVGIRDNFFDLGGHSLLLVKTHARLCEVLDRDLKVVDLFAHPTIEALARQLGDKAPSNLLAQDARARVTRRNGSSTQVESIAIIGMAGRFPGAANVESLWANLRVGRDSVVFFSRDEMRESGVPDALLDDPNYVGARGYLEDSDKFDAAFFGYSAREAELMDPQHRLLLECAAEALDAAGYDPDRYGGLIAVYAGSSMNTYLSNLRSAPGLQAPSSGLTRVLASGQDFLTTRLSYKLNLRGPSMNLQTACSTSLVAVHEACRALRDHECDMALAGGVSVTVPTKSGYVYVQEGIGSPDGRCRAFDADASGTVGGNGVGLVLLKRFSDALADGDHIHAVIRGSAINNDGSSKVGYTAPSVEGQAAAIAMAQAAADFDPESIGYVETHGTGTLLGDPIEISALTRAFGDAVRRNGPCWLGALKTNVGHLDAAAGVAGLIKATLSLEHRELVPILNFSKPNPQIDFAAGPFRVNTELRPWESPPGVPRRAGVSSFGLGGTNAHVVLEEAPPAEPSGPSREWQVVCLSAKSAPALQRAKANLAGYLGAHPHINLADAAFTLQAGRREFTHRCTVVCRDLAGAVSALEGGAPERVNSGIFKGGERSVVFMFSGQGVQYPNMGLGLYRSEPVFRETIDRCCEKLKAHLGLDLRDVLFPAEDALERAAEQIRRTELTQPALFVVEYALATLWMSFGIRPAAMAGHSIGEYAAACIAGVMSVDDALALVAERGRLMGQLPVGAMLAVPLGEADVLPLLGDRLSIAAVNSPSLCVVSGPEDGIAVLEARLLEREIQTRRLHTSHAFHSSMMDTALKPFTQRARNVVLKRPQVAYISNVTGDWITPEQATDPTYYATHLRQAVRFSKGLEQLFADSNRVFLEVGPGNTLTALAKRHPARLPSHEFIASMRHAEEHRPDEMLLAESAGRLWLAGVPADWTAFHGGHHRRRVRLPAYPFERTRYWIEPGKAAAGTAPPGRARVGRNADPAEWIYVPSWKRAPALSGTPEKRATRWLCFADGRGLGARIEAELTASGADVTSISIGDGYAKLGDGRYTLNPRERDDYDSLTADLVASSCVPECIVHLWTVDADDDLRADEAFVAGCQDRGYFSLVFLVQALAARGLAAPLKLAVISTHVHEISGDEMLCPEKAMVLGPCKVIGMEHPDIRTRAIDVTLNGDLQWLARAVTTDLQAPWTDPVAAYRGRYRWVQAFEQTRMAPRDTAPAVLRESGAYLITGGLGGIGLEIAEYLARTVRAKIALVSRTALPDREQWARCLAERDESDSVSRRIRRIQAIEAAGGTVLLCKADVSDQRQMTEAVAEAEARLGPLRGVMHAAGAVKRGTPIRSLQRADCEEQFLPRLQGLRVLESVLRGKDLDFCVVNSSLASVMGVMDFASYTASHLFMDAFVHQHNRAVGVPWRVINWDNWNIGDRDAERRGPAMTEFYMGRREAAGVLGGLLSMTDAPQVLVSTGDLQGRVDRWIARDERSGNRVEAAHESPATHAHPRPALSTEYAAPRNEVERGLAEIWREMLGIDRVGIHDNFFELGGDSVLNIQITAKANQAGIRVTPKQVFEHQTIAGLAAIAGAGIAGETEQDVVFGAVPLTPIQRWFFDRNLARPQHFNLPMLLEVRRPLDVDVIEKAIARLERHHDALRFRYSRGAAGWEQRLVEPSRKIVVHVHDLAGMGADEQSRQIEAIGTRLQGTLDLATGPLLQAAYFDRGPAQSGRLLLVVHHLAVDMISWRVLLEDLQSLYGSPGNGGDVRLPAKTASIKRWSEALTAYAQTGAAEAALQYWKEIGAKPVSRLPVDADGGANTVGASARIFEELGAEETRALLTDLPKAYGTQINDALLLALVKSVCGWTRGNAVLVDLEGHGREAILDGIDVSRTVGWFTTLCPVRLQLPAMRGHRHQIRSVHEQLMAVPNHGMDFGILRYLNTKPEVRAALEKVPGAEISFLYMGQFDHAFAPDALFGPAAETAGPAHDPSGERHHLLEINSVIRQGRLQMSWTYSRDRHDEQTIRSLAQAYFGVLRSLIASCKDAEPGDGAPLEIRAGAISEADLAEIARQLAAQNKVVI